MTDHAELARRLNSMASVDRNRFKKETVFTRVLDESAADIRELARENAELRAALQKYGRHDYKCPATYDANAPKWMKPGKCTCGLAEILGE